MKNADGSFRADWKNPENYPPLNCDDYRRLVWEFIRRNKDYARDVAVMRRLTEEEFKNGLEKNASTCLDGLQCYPKARPGEIAAEYFARMGKAKRPCRIVNPREYFRSRWCMDIPVSPETPYESCEIEFTEDLIRVKRPKENRPSLYRLHLWPDEIALRFRLDLSFDTQLEYARRRFDQERAAYAKNVKNAGLDRRLTGLEMAHYWLRCYDAKKTPTPRMQGAPRNSPRENGPMRVAAFLNNEKTERCISGLQVGGAIKKTDLTAKPIEKHTINDWRKSAALYIDKKKYLLLVYSQDPRTVTAAGRRQRASRKKA